jgi:hypothetical protein
MKFLFISFNLFLYLISYFNYEGSIFILSFFCISSNFYLIYSFRKKHIFTEIFLASFLWLGFWFKFVMIITKVGYLTEGSGLFDFSGTSYDRALLILSFAFFLLIIMSYLREQFFFSYEEFSKKKFFIKEKSIDFYFNYQNYFLVIFILLVLFCAIINLKFSIYQKGIISNQLLNPVFLSIFKWLTMFGFASFSSFIIFCFIKRKKNIFIAFFISLFEGFVTSYGFLSRASLIFSQISFFLGFKKIIELSNNPFSKKKVFLYLFLIIFISFTAIHFINLKRDQYHFKNYFNFEKDFATIKTIDLTSAHAFSVVKNIISKNQTIYLLFNRWVGLDSWFAVTSHPNLSSNLFFDSFNEKFNKNKFTYYQNNFLGKKNIDYIPEFQKNYGVVLPGFFSFSFYSGSIFFFLALIAFFYMLGAFLEYISFRFSFGNIIFASFISQVYVYRLIHFGYLPSQSYLLLGALIFNILLYYFFVLLTNKKKIF